MPAIWPTGVAGDGDLFVAKNNLSTTLNGAVDAVTTTIVLTSAAAFPASGYVTIGTEAIKYTGISTNTLTGVTRGADGTTAASHLNGTAVNHYAVAAHHNAPKDEIIAVETQLAAEMAATKEPTGFPDASTTTISVVDGTRTFTIAPTGASFDVYVQGKKFTKTSESVTFTDTEGVWFFYYNSAGTLTSSQTSWSLINDAPVALLYWDAANNVSLDLANERHGCSMDGATHQYLHNTVGTRFGNGLAASGYVLNSAANADVRFAFDAGNIYDEDLKIDIAAKTEPAQIPVFYRSGLAGMWRRAVATDYPYLTTGTGRIAYNLNTAGTWSQAEVNNGDFAAYWIFATNGANYPIIAIQGQRQDTSLANAQNNNLYESLAFGTLPYAEMKLLYRVIVQTSNAYGSTMKVRVAEVQDLRSVSNLPAGSYVATDHNSLTGRSTAASHPATAISNTPAGTIAATDVQAAIDELDTEKEAVSNKSTDGTLAANSTTLYPSQSAVKTYADTKQAALGFTPVNVAGDTMSGDLAVTHTGISRLTVKTSSASGSRAAILRLNEVNTGGNDGTGQVLFTYDTDYKQAAAIKATLTAGGAAGVLKLYTGTTEQVMIDASGNVGLKTTPGANLHVLSNTGDVDSGIRVERTSATTGRYNIIVDASGNLKIGEVDGGTKRITLAKTTGYLTVPGVYDQTDASAANVYVDSSGNLKRSTASAGGSGTVNNGTAGYLTYYPSTGTTVDDTTLYHAGNGGLQGLGTGTVSWQVSANINGATGGTAQLLLTAAGNTSVACGDSVIRYSTNTPPPDGFSDDWYAGVDASDSNKFKISRSFGSSDVLMCTPTQVQTGMAGSVGTPAIAVNADVNTGIWAPASDTWAVSTGGSEALRANSSQQLGVGTNNPGYRLDVQDAGGSDVLNLGGTSAGTVAIRIAPNGTSSNTAKIIGTKNGTNTDLSFRTGGSDRMMVDYNGKVGINRTPVNYRCEILEADANTSITQYPLAIIGSTTGTAAAGLGTGLIFVGKSSDGSHYDNLYIEANQTAVGAGSQSVDFVIKSRKAGSFTTRFTIFGSTSYVQAIGVYQQTTASAANVYVDSSGNIMRSTSSLRYKTAVKDVSQEEAVKLLDVTPVTYASLCEGDNKEERHYGFIAEEVDLLDPVLVNYKTLEDGTKVPDGVQYERVVVGLLKLVQDLTKRVADLEAKQA